MGACKPLVTQHTLDIFAALGVTPQLLTSNPSPLKLFEKWMVATLAGREGHGGMHDHIFMEIAWPSVSFPVP